MASYDQLDFRDIRDTYRLVGECRDVGWDPRLWGARAMEGLCALVGARSATGGEGVLVGRDRVIRPLSAIQWGLDGQALASFSAYMAEGAVPKDPFIGGLYREPRRVVTRSRSSIIDDAVYYKAFVVNEYLRPAGITHRLGSIYKSKTHPRISNFHLHRESGEKDFSERDRQLLDLFHMELGRLIGRSLVSATEPGPEGLSPRLRQTLGYLLEGESEKQIASRLGVSHATAHQYVTALYRRFGVHSRSQLLALFITRSRPQ